MKKCYYDAEKIEIDLETLEICLGKAVSDKLQNVHRCWTEIHNRENNNIHFSAKQLAKEAHYLEYVTDIYDAIRESKNREKLIIKNR